MINQIRLSNSLLMHKALLLAMLLILLAPSTSPAQTAPWPTVKLYPPGPVAYDAAAFNIFTVTKAFASLPGTATTVIEGITYSFQDGSVIRTSATPYFYHLATIAGVSAWTPFGGGTVINQSISYVNPTGAETDQAINLPTAFARRDILASLTLYGPSYDEVIAFARVSSVNSVNWTVDGNSESLFSAFARVANYSEQIGGATTEYYLSHGQSGWVLAQSFEDSGEYRQVRSGLRRVSDDEIAANFAVAPTTGAYRVNVLAASGTVVIGDGAATEYAVSVPTSTRSTFIQVWENTDPFRLVTASILHHTIDSVTIGFKNPPLSNTYRVLYAPVGALDSTDFTDIFVMLDGSNRAFMTGTHGNNSITIIANKFQGDGTDITNVNAERILEKSIKETVPGNTEYLIYNTTLAKWVSSVGPSFFYNFYVDGETFYPSSVYDYYNINTGHGLASRVADGSYTIEISSTFTDDFMRLDGTTAMENHFNGGGYDIINVNLIRAATYYSNGFEGMTSEFQIVSDIEILSSTMIISNYFDVGFSGGILTLKTEETGSTLIGTFMPYNTAWYDAIFTDGDIPDSFYRVTGDTLEGPMNANSQAINSPTTVDIRTDGVLKLPRFKASEAPNPLDATPWLQNHIPDRGMAIFEDAGLSWWLFLRSNEKLKGTKLLTEAEMLAVTEAEVHHLSVRVQDSPAISMYVRAVTMAGQS